MKSAGFDNATALARAAGMNPTNLLRWIDGASTPSVDALRKIAPLVGVRLGDLMIRAGMATREELGTVGAPPPPGPPLVPEVRVLVSRLQDPRLTERQKLALRLLIRNAVEAFDNLVEAPPREPPTTRRRS